MNKKSGWYQENERHVLAGKGIKTTEHKLIASGHTKYTTHPVKDVGPYTVEVELYMGDYVFTIVYKKEGEELIRFKYMAQYEAMENYDMCDSENDIKRYLKQNAKDYDEIIEAYPELGLK